jgi:high-affinity iron transporter
MTGLTWSDIVHNLLIGLRGGLEAGLVVSLLLAALGKAAAAGAGSGRRAGGARHRAASPEHRAASPDHRAASPDHRAASPDHQAGKIPAAPVWLGVLAAGTFSGGLAAVLTASPDAVSSRALAAAGGLVSVLAVGAVTAVIFWMRRTAASLGERPRGEAGPATAMSAAALTMTAFLVVGRAGLDTVILRTADPAGQSAAQLAGTAAGLAVAVALCWLLSRLAVRLNVAAFFHRSAIALIAIAAGVLAYGLGEMQGAGLLSGQRWIAVDLTAHAHSGSWWVSLFSGVTGLTPGMTVLQVVAWIAYLAVVIPAFATAGARGPSSAAPRRSTPADAPAPAAAGWWERQAGRQPWTAAWVLVVVPAIAAGATIAALPAAASASSTTVTVTRTACAPGWTSAAGGTQTFTVDNQSGLPGEINLDDTSGDIVAEIETIGPATSAQLTATLTNGTYVFKCFMGPLAATTSQAVQVTGAPNSSATSRSASSPVAAGPVAVKPATVAELTGPNKEYQGYAALQLADLAREVTRIQSDLHGNDVAAAKADWLAAQLDWERVGASYDSFGNLGLAVDGLPNGLQGGVSDKQFTGLHRLEYGLWHGQSAASLLPVAATLATDVGLVQKNLTSANLAGNPANLPVRAHEILEDALRDHLSGIDNEGGGAAYAQTYADLQVTEAVLGYLTPLLNARQPGLPEIADGYISDLQQALLATRINGKWESLGSASVSARENVDSAIDAVLETLAAVPDLLEVPPTR